MLSSKCSPHLQLFMFCIGGTGIQKMFSIGKVFSSLFGFLSVIFFFQLLASHLFLTFLFFNCLLIFGFQLISEFDRFQVYCLREIMVPNILNCSFYLYYPVFELIILIYQLLGVLGFWGFGVLG